MSDSRSRALLWIVIGGGTLFLVVLAAFALIFVSMRGERDSGGVFGEKIAVVDVEGVIIDARETVESLRKYADDSSIKAIILRINTPGGGAAASQEIYTEVKRIRDRKKKPIIAAIETLGASGGYYVASAADKIYANPASIVGSIGVIAQWYNYAELVKWAKLKEITFKAGEFKDTGSPTRDLTPEERVYLQSLIDDMHAQFIAAVAEGRKLKLEDVKSIANGKVWTGSQAMPLKLVDQLSDFRGVVETTARQVGIKGEPTLVHPEKQKRTLLDLLFGDASELIPDRAKLMQTNVGFYYLWK